ncbi:MAG TPA: PAS domain-containing protein, partial [Candidatus Competibacter sp.]|nr:PAS domain-containing protein [Candidatus Competibacter sp.]
YRQLADSLEEGVVYQNAHGVITFANAAAERILMLAKDPANGRIVTHPHWSVLRENGVEWPADQHPAMIALRTRLPVKAMIMGLRNARSGQTRWLRLSAMPLLEADTEQPALQVCSIFHEITETVETARQLSHVQEDLRQVTALAQPSLAALAARINALEESGTAGEDSQAWRDRAHESLKMLQRLVGKIATLSPSGEPSSSSSH